MTFDMPWRALASPEALDGVRRRVADAAVGAPDEAVYDAQTVAVELVTNAWLHGRPPVRLDVDVRDGAILVAVADSGHGLPAVQPESDSATVGRGLRLISALTTQWGVEPQGVGKAVWAHVPLDGTGTADLEPDVDVEALIASWPDEEVGLVPIRIRRVPVRMLVATMTHNAEVVRELRLLLAGASSATEPQPPGLAEIAAALEYDWGPEQRVLHQQLADAVDDGRDTLDIEMHLPSSAAEAGSQLLAALDAADALSRAGRLLTPEQPASEIAFRHWWVTSVIEQLRAHGRGEPAPRLPSLTEVLAERVDRLNARATAWDRLQVLQRVTGELSGATTIAEVATIVADNAAAYMGALGARVYVADEHGALHSMGWHGRIGNAADQFDTINLDTDLPGATVARTGKPVVLRHVGEIYRTIPALAGYYPTDRTLHIHPVRIGDRNLGLLGVTFGTNELEESDQVEFVQALADALAQALERVQALEQARARADRLRLLADASIALNASLDLQETVDAVTRVLVPRLADWAVVQILRDGTLDNASIHHPDPAKIAWVRSLEGRWPVDMDAPTGAPAVIRSGLSEIYPYIPDELITAGAQDDEHLDALRALGMNSVLVAPLAGRSGIIGALSLIYAESGRRYSDDDLQLVEDMARRAAFAIETAAAFREQSGRLADVVQVAEAAQRAILAEMPTRLGSVNLAAAYRSSAAEATVGGDLFEAIPHPNGVWLLIGDVRGKGLAAVRTASLVLGAARAAADDFSSLTAAAKDIDRRLRRHLTAEDFVTACLVEISPSGAFAVVSAGHPPPMLIGAAGIRPVELDPSPPLGLGAAPQASVGQLSPGDRLLLYTDGLSEARLTAGGFVVVEDVLTPLIDRPLRDALSAVVSRLDEVSGRVDDDLALLVAEFDPIPRQPRATQDQDATGQPQLTR